MLNSSLPIICDVNVVLMETDFFCFNLLPETSLAEVIVSANLIVFPDNTGDASLLRCEKQIQNEL